jgi:quinol monooxygenase YgiN
MITEIATIVIDPAKDADFEDAVTQAAPHFRAARGCHGMVLDRCIENPARYFLRVEWESVDHHMVIFRESEGFQNWRTLAGPFFAEPPVVVHSVRTVTGF